MFSIASDTEAIGADRVARLTDSLGMLPTALYWCSLRGALVYEWTPEDGTVERLNAEDLNDASTATEDSGKQPQLLLLISSGPSVVRSSVPSIIV